MMYHLVSRKGKTQNTTTVLFKTVLGALLCSRCGRVAQGSPFKPIRTRFKKERIAYNLLPS